MILTDSLSSVSALSSRHTSSRYLVLKIASLLSGLPPNKVTVQWVPIHIGIPGNELADSVAKRSFHLSCITQVPLPGDDVCLRLKSHYAALWQSHWDLFLLVCLSPSLMFSLSLHASVYLAESR